MRASSKTMKTLIWILMAMLIFGLGGFGITNLGGAVRSVGEVGDKTITTDAYARALRQTLQGRTGPSGRPLTFAEAREQNLDRIVLSQMVSTRVLDHETAQLGISVGDERLGAQIFETDAFKGFDGKFSREGYAERLRQIGLTERQYEEIVREEMARGIVETALFSDIQVTPVFAETIVNFIGARRDFTWAEVTENDLTAPLPAADEATLKAFYEENSARYMRPALKNITYAWLTPDMMIDKVELDETNLRALFEERSAELNRPERRIVERLVFADEASAEAAKAALDAGEKTFEALVEERGLALEDVDMGDVSQDELEEAGAAVFAAESGAVVGPLETSLGPALFRINAVLEAQVTTFEDVEAELRDELGQERASRLIEDQIDRLEDLLAAGATLEEIAEETDMELGAIGWHAASEIAPSGYEAFRAAAAAVTLEDFPELITLEDGGLIALRLDGEEPEALRPFEEVADSVEQDERLKRLQEALAAKANALNDELAQGKSFEELSLTPRVEEGLTRSDFIEEAPVALLTGVFGLAEVGDSIVVAGDARSVALARLDGMSPPNEDDADLVSARALLEAQLQNDLAQDVFQLYVTDIQSRTPISIDENAINAVNAQFQ